MYKARPRPCNANTEQEGYCHGDDPSDCNGAPRKRFRHFCRQFFTFRIRIQPQLLCLRTRHFLCLGRGREGGFVGIKLDISHIRGLLTGCVGFECPDGSGYQHKSIGRFHGIGAHAGRQQFGARVIYSAAEQDEENGLIDDGA